MPVENRLDMELTGIKTPVGLKIQGPDVDRDSTDRFADRGNTRSPSRAREEFSPNASRKGFYINVEVDRAVAARYGLTVGDVQRAVSSGIGGENIATDRRRARALLRSTCATWQDYRNDLNALAPRY